MEISAIIAEYNPIHLGHKYQIDTIKEKTNSDIITIMSGDFVQRGECAILDKYKRAELAVKNGVSLVIELPYYFSLQSAENFSLGSIKILNSLNVVDNLCFGFECDDKKTILDVADFQVEFKNEIDEKINEYMKQGFSYAVAYKNSCLDVNKEKKNIDIPDEFFISNNILSLEYIKSIKKTNSKMNILPIKRVGQNYNSEDYNSKLQLSATSIRNAVFSGNLKMIEEFIEKNTFEELKKANESKKYQDNKKLMDILKFSILSQSINEEKIIHYENGMVNLIKNNIFNFDDFEEFISCIQSKRYKKVRLKRFIMNYLLNVTNEIKSIYEKEPEYIKVLAFNENGANILKKIKENSDIKIITKNKDTKILSKAALKQYELEQNIRKLYKLLTNNSQNEEFINFFVK